MSRFSFLILFSLVFTGVKSQVTYALSKTPNEVYHQRLAEFDTYAASADKVFIITQNENSKKRKLEMDIYDSKTFNKIKSVTIDNISVWAKPYFTDIIRAEIYLAANKVFVFYYDHKKNDDNKLELKLIVYDETGLKVLPQRSFDTLDVFYNQVAFSPDKSKFAVAGPKGYIVYETSTFKKLYDRTNATKSGELKLVAGELAMNNSGDVLRAMYTNNERGSYNVIAGLEFTAQNETQRLFGITDEFQVRNIILSNSDNDFVVSGYYNQYREKKGPQPKVGSYFLTVEGGTGKTKNFTMEFFDENLHKRMEYRKGIFDGGMAFKNFEPKELVKNGDSYYLFETQSYSGYTDQSMTEPFSGERELLVTKYTADGKRQWTAVVPKWTKNKMKNYHYLFMNNKLRIIYPDHPSNLEIDPETGDLGKLDVIENNHGSLMVVADVDYNSGKIQRNALRGNGDFYTTPVNKTVKLNNGNALLYKFVDGKTFYYGSITFN